VSYVDPQYQDPDPDPDPESHTVTLNRDQIRAMERDAKRTREVEKENIFLRAAIDIDTPLGKLFYTGYADELNVEKVKESWTALTAQVTPAATPPEPQPQLTPEQQAARTALDAQEAQFQAQRAANATGATGEDGGQSVDPRKTAIDEGQKVIAEGGSREDAGAAFFSRMAGAAAAGDKRAMVTYE
jgi:hypothetical protein